MAAAAHDCAWLFPWGGEKADGLDLERESRSVGVFGAEA